METVCFTNVHRLDLLPSPDISFVYLFNDSKVDVIFAVPRQVEVFSCGLLVSIHIVQVLNKSFSEGPACLTNVLLLTPDLGTGDGIADVLAVTVHLTVQVNFVGGG